MSSLAAYGHLCLPRRSVALLALRLAAPAFYLLTLSFGASWPAGLCAEEPEFGLSMPLLVAAVPGDEQVAGTEPATPPSEPPAVPQPAGEAPLPQAPPEVSEAGAVAAQPAVTAVSALAAAPPLVSNVFVETDIRQALSDIAAATGATIIADESVTGLVTLELSDCPLERALELVSLPGGLVFEAIEPGVYLVTSPDPKSPNFARVAKTQVVELDYVKSDELQQLLPDIHARFAKFDKGGGQVTVTAPPRHLEDALAAIKQLDQPRVGVMIEALIVETSAGNARNLEISFGGRHVNVNTRTGILTYVGEAQELLHQLLWLVTREEAQIKASPRIIALEGEEATVKVATEQYFQIVTGRVGYEYTTLQAIEAAVGLTITPTVAREDRRVTCKIAPEVGDVTGKGANDLPIITRRTATTTACVADGQIIAIGGLLQSIKSEIERKVPLLGDIPLIGKLFRSKKTEVTEKETIIFIVPHILDENGSFEGPLLLERVDLNGEPTQETGTTQGTDG